MKKPVFTACTFHQFIDLPHTRWSVRVGREVKLSGKIVAVKLFNDCSVTSCKTVKEAEALFRKLAYGA